ncbi:MAG: isopentenyl-diphosphate Delta-isomerase [Aestuariivita sp.]|nr:isopentenyl-diphosphate Delta-isomerase [Aestuariivita sp.]MCY4345704.1 isopentenyl-diphosphate Delta-isomerase [Aestuariivita sp.]
MTTMIPTWVNGKLQPVEKLKAHRRGLRHQAISVFVLRGEKILLQQRALGKYHTPGLWANACCTHPHWGEASEACATRRLREELGISGLSLAHRHNLEYRADVGGGLIEHEVVDVYVAHAADGIAMSPNPEEVMNTAWISYHDLIAKIDADPGDYTPWLQIYMNDYAMHIFGSEMVADEA